jgi:ubiquinone/menaquinone biosynthesis C-methylase UbiE
MAVSDRATLSGKVKKALAQPQRVLPYARRLAGNARLRVAAGNHTEFYRAVMRREVAKDPDRAIGSDSRESWLAVGQRQYDYLVQHGLNAASRILDVGCGNLRAGWRIAQTVDPGNYYGVDISPDVLRAAQDTIVEFGVEDRFPHLTLVDDLRLSFLPAASFDIIHAHSVFSHTRQDVLEQALDSLPRLLTPSGFFDFTYFESEDRPRVFADEDFYYPTRLLVEMAESRGLHAERMSDWGEYVQAKMRVRRA